MIFTQESLSQELDQSDAVDNGPLAKDDVDLSPEMILAATYKIQLLYTKVDENMQIKVSEVNRNKIFPKLPGMDTKHFIEVKNGIWFKF